MKNPLKQDGSIFSINQALDLTSVFILSNYMWLIRLPLFIQSNALHAIVMLVRAVLLWGNALAIKLPMNIPSMCFLKLMGGKLRLTLRSNYAAMQCCIESHVARWRRRYVQFAWTLVQDLYYPDSVIDLLNGTLANNDEQSLPVVSACAPPLLRSCAMVFKYYREHVSMDGTYDVKVAAAYRNGIILVWDIKRGDQRKHLDAQSVMAEQIVKILFHPKFQVLVSNKNLWRIISFHISADV